ncbi:MAG: hypothetical protein FWG92_01480 [Leptospirales bacterium]|nr:hypothetical protein [Leptospirales bacterium]
MTKRNYKNILAALLLLSSLCCIGLGTTKKETANFTDEGFISNNEFQVILRGFPDKKNKTLVAQRETARTNAVALIENVPISKLAEHVCAIAGYTGLSETIELFRKYKKYGYIYEEFYLIDNSITIVYRFRKNGLKKDIESFPCGGKK